MGDQTSCAGFSDMCTCPIQHCRPEDYMGIQRQYNITLEWIQALQSICPRSCNLCRDGRILSTMPDIEASESFFNASEGSADSAEPSRIHHSPPATTTQPPSPLNRQLERRVEELERRLWALERQL